MRRRRDMQPERTGQRPIDENAEQPGVVVVVVFVAEPTAEIRNDRPFPQVGVVAEAVDRVLLFFARRQAVVDLVEQGTDTLAEWGNRTCVRN